ncbi:MAG TPA: branched-chain amino acid ABC transporter permease [Acidimicrobiales bacterium]|nr:branched-chain amino acid ABC transporter permease [Acidimicrobiales bacterium]
MQLFVNVLLSGVVQGMAFAVVALGLVLISRATGIVNFAQGAMGMFTTFIAFSLLTNGLGYWPAFAATLAIGFAFGAVVERTLIRPLQGKPALNSVIVTIGLLVVLEGLAGSIWGNVARGFPAAFSQRGLVIGTTRVAFSQFDVFIVCAVALLVAAVVALFRWTDLGLRMRAAAFSPEVSRLLGVRVGRLFTLGWALACAAGSLAGLIVAPLSSFSPYYMDLYLVYGFTAAVLGGLLSPAGAVVGGLATGLAIAFVGGYLGSDLQPIAALALLLLVLTLRPQGLFGTAEIRRV